MRIRLYGNTVQDCKQIYFNQFSQSVSQSVRQSINHSIEVIVNTTLVNHNTTSKVNQELIMYVYIYIYLSMKTMSFLKSSPLQQQHTTYAFNFFSMLVAYSLK